MSSSKDSGSSSFVIAENPLLNSDYIGATVEAKGVESPSPPRLISNKVSPLSANEEGHRTESRRASMELEVSERQRLSHELDPNEPANIIDSYKGSCIPDRDTTVVIKKGSRMTKRMWTRDFIGLYAHYAGVG